MLILYHNGVDINYLNTYILVPSLTFLFFIGSVTQGFSQKKITLIFSLIFAVLLPTSVYYSLLRINKHDFYLQSYLNQPTCRNLHSLSYYLAIHGPKDELLKYSQVQ